MQKDEIFVTGIMVTLAVAIVLGNFPLVCLVPVGLFTATIFLTRI